MTLETLHDWAEPSLDTDLVSPTQVQDASAAPAEGVLAASMASLAAVQAQAEERSANPFGALGLSEPMVRAVTAAGHTEPTLVQQRAIPLALAGRDLMVSSATGSGKTASYLLPALQNILDGRSDPEQKRQRGPAQGPRVLVLTPTRELALQVGEAVGLYGRSVPGLRLCNVLGGVPYGLQLRQLAGPLDILIATPGRLLDHLRSGKAVLRGVQTLVLDEADRMLDLGFMDDLRAIAEHLPAKRQTVMYSATFAGNVARLAQDLLQKPERVSVTSHTESHADIEQRLHWADNLNHKQALLDHILAERGIDQALVFTSTQRDADWLADRLAAFGHKVASLHGGLPQGRRNRVLQGLRDRRLRVLVATDVAARGIDVPTISHVINYGLPLKAEDYVHRIGRTGRAGRQGVAITLAEAMDAPKLRRIQAFTTQTLPVATIDGLEPQRAMPSLTGRPVRPDGPPHRRGPGHPAGRSGRPPARFGRGR